jgi:hypothetical protein
MARNYGISFCRTGIRLLEEKEEQMFETLGHGFDKFSKENLQLMRYKRMLKTFIHERDEGMRPSYNPDIHGSLGC